MPKLPVWSDALVSGDDAVDSCHREMVVCLTRIREALAASKLCIAERVTGELYDLCAIHAQIEDNCFVGYDHDFPHEALDDQVVRLRAAMRNRVARHTMFDMLGAIGHTLLSDISVDKRDLAAEAA